MNAGVLGRRRDSNGRSPRSNQNGSLSADSGKSARGLTSLSRLPQRGQPPRKTGSPKEIIIFYFTFVVKLKQ